MLEKEFVPYEGSLALKELGFDEPCFGFYTEEYKSLIKNFCKYPINLPTKPFLAPTFSQSFRWFREKYDLFIAIVHYENGYSINDLRRFETYEEAELECLRKLIEIVKEK